MTKNQSKPSALRNELSNERGAAMLEYSLIAAAIAIVCIASVSMVGNEANKTFVTVGRKLANTNFPVVVDPF
jgi:Flp pilus assembly pilin Flp